MPEASPRTARRVDSDDDVEALAQEILSAERTVPVIGVTSKPGAGGPFLDADALAARLGDLATVWVLEEPDLAWALTDAVPQKLDCYGGAARAWMPNVDPDEPYPSDHPQWTMFSPDEGARALELIAQYVQLTSERPLPAFGDTTTATVTTVRKAGAELELATGHPGFVSIGHLIQHGEVFHAADVLQEGQEVKVRVGAWNPHAGRLSVTMREFAPDPWERAAEVYEPGMIIEGGVSGVTAFGAFVEILPGVEGLLHKSKISDEFVEYVDDYVRQGDRITVRLLDLDVRGQKAGVSLRDVPRGAEPVPPASIFPGGPPWLPMPGGSGSAEGPSSAEGAGDGDLDADGFERGAGDFVDADDAVADAALLVAAVDATARATTAPEAIAPEADYAGKLRALTELIAAFGAAVEGGAAGGAAVEGGDADAGVASGDEVAATDEVAAADEVAVAADEVAVAADEVAVAADVATDPDADDEATPDVPGDLPTLLRQALELGIAAFDARLDEADEGSEDPEDPLVQLRNAAADLIDALRGPI